jgi:phosphoribosylformylglycinamidine cyclo-ligase
MSDTKQSSAYSAAGVDIESGNIATQLMAATVKSTYTPEVLAGIGAFGGMFSAAGLAGMRSPVLVASTDGVGTKTKVAAKLNRWDTIGQDLVNHCVNDILVQGAQPLFFLDYVASSKLNPHQIATIVSGVAAACRIVGCALLGGETAEMPGVYHDGEVDLVGTIIGVVERDSIINGSTIQAGDQLLGLPSHGLHTNGYSLARRILDDHPEAWDQWGNALLAVHRCYLAEVKALWAAGVTIRGLAHITGGGLIENPPRIFPPGLGAVIREGSWAIPPLFTDLERLGNVARSEMYRVFNMGIGMVVTVHPSEVASVQNVIPEAQVIGEMVEGAGDVRIE